MQFYSFILILTIGVSFRIFLNKKRKDKVDNFAKEIDNIIHNITSKTDKIVSKFENFEKKVNSAKFEIKKQSDKKYKKNISHRLGNTYQQVISYGDLERSSELTKIDERWLYQVQKIETYYHEEIPDLLEAYHPPKILGISQYIDIGKLHQIFQIYDPKRKEALTSDKIVGDKIKRPDFLKAIK